MKHLFILRHAKAAPFSEDYEDFNRPLEAVGKHSLIALSKHIKRENFTPEVILCSSSRRTKETSEEVRNTFPHLPEATYLDDLYLASASHLLRLIQQIDERFSQVLLVGHNPGLEQLVENLLLETPVEPLKSQIKPYPLAGLAYLELPVKNWSEVDFPSAYLKDFCTPTF